MSPSTNLNGRHCWGECVRKKKFYFNVKKCFRHRGYKAIMTTNVVPPTDVPTDDEFADISGVAEFRGRRVVRRKLRDSRDKDDVLSE